MRVGPFLRLFLMYEHPAKPVRSVLCHMFLMHRCIFESLKPSFVPLQLAFFVSATNSPEWCLQTVRSCTPVFSISLAVLFPLGAGTSLQLISSFLGQTHVHTPG